MGPIAYTIVYILSWVLYIASCFSHRTYISSFCTAWEIKSIQKHWIYFKKIGQWIYSPPFLLSCCMWIFDSRIKETAETTRNIPTVGSLDNIWTRMAATSATSYDLSPISSQIATLIAAAWSLIRIGRIPGESNNSRSFPKRTHLLEMNAWKNNVTEPFLFSSNCQQIQDKKK